MRTQFEGGSDFTPNFEVEVSWPIGPTLQPELRLVDDLGHNLMVEVEPCLRTAYEWMDACEAAPSGEEPPSWKLLSTAQLKTLRRIQLSWKQIRTSLARLVNDKDREYIEWSNLKLHAAESQGEVCITLRGTCDPPYRSSEYTEHGLSAELHLDQVLEFCDHIFKRVRTKATKVAIRPHPLFVELTSRQVTEHLNAEDWDALREALKSSNAAVFVGEIAASWWWRLPPETAILVFEDVRPFFNRPHVRLTHHELKNRPAEMTRMMVEAGCCLLPHEPFGHNLQFCLHDLDLFQAYLTVGVDPSPLIDEFGVFVPGITMDHVELLQKAHPALVVKTQEDEEPPAYDHRQLLRQWLKAGWIEVEDDANHNQVAAAVAALIESEQPVEQVADALMELPGVAELHISDDTLKYYIENW